MLRNTTNSTCLLIHLSGKTVQMQCIHFLCYVDVICIIFQAILIALCMKMCFDIYNSCWLMYSCMLSFPFCVHNVYVSNDSPAVFLPLSNIYIEILSKNVIVLFTINYLSKLITYLQVNWFWLSYLDCLSQSQSVCLHFCRISKKI